MTNDFQFLMIYLLSVLGLILIYLEFFLPSAIFAILGSASLVAAIALTFFQSSIFWGCLHFIIIGFFVFLICKGALWQIKRPKGKLYLSQDQEGFVASSFDRTLIGKNAIAATELKPAGFVKIEGKRHQALSESGFVNREALVYISGGKGAYLIIHAINIKD